MKSVTHHPQITRYLSQLEKELKILPPEEREDTLKEIRSHIFEQLQPEDFADDERVQAVLNRLGAPKSYARSLVGEHLQDVIEHGAMPTQFALFMKQAMLPMLGVTLLFTGLMLSNTAFIFAELISQGKIGWETTFWMLFWNLPAILVVVSPIAVLFGVALYVYRSLGLRSEWNKLVRSFKLWGVILGIGLGCSGFIFILQDQIVPFANQQTVRILKDMMQTRAQQEQKAPLFFSEQKDIRQMGSVEAYHYLKTQPEGVKKQIREQYDFYTKFSLPLSNLSSALLGGMIGVLMASGLFQPLYTLVVLGGMLTILFWYQLYALSASDYWLNAHNIVWMSFLPDLVLAGVALLVLTGIWLGPKPESQTE